MSKLSAQGKIKELDLEGHVNSVLKEAVTSHESESRERHAQMLSEFEAVRHERLFAQREHNRVAERKKELGERLLRLHEQERRFRFYEEDTEVRRRIADVRQQDGAKERYSEEGLHDGDLY